MRIAPVMLLALVLAGCASPAHDAVTPAAATGPAPSPAEAPSTTPHGPSPDSSPSPTPATPSASPSSPTTNATPPPKPLTVSFSGSFRPGACVFALVGACPGLPLGDGVTKDIGPGAKVVGGSLTMTWTSDSALNDKLGFTLASVGSCGQGCTSFTALDKATLASGASPVKLDIKGTYPVKGGEIGLFAWKPCEVEQDPLLVCAFTNQAFKVEGTLLVAT